ncbi:hypothetical protein BGX33_007005, partial [Mortierella sp. NVP41]
DSTTQQHSESGSPDYWTPSPSAQSFTAPQQQIESGSSDYQPPSPTGQPLTATHQQSESDAPSYYPPSPSPFVDSSPSPDTLSLVSNPSDSSYEEPDFPTPTFEFLQDVAAAATPPASPKSIFPSFIIKPLSPGIRDIERERARKPYDGKTLRQHKYPRLFGTNSFGTNRDTIHNNWDPVNSNTNDNHRNQRINNNNIKTNSGRRSNIHSCVYNNKTNMNSDNRIDNRNNNYPLSSSSSRPLINNDGLSSELLSHYNNSSRNYNHSNSINNIRNNNNNNNNSSSSSNHIRHGNDRHPLMAIENIIAIHTNNNINSARHPKHKAEDDGDQENSQHYHQKQQEQEEYEQRKRGRLH